MNVTCRDGQCSIIIIFFFALILHDTYLETYLPGGHGMFYLTTVAYSTYHVPDAILTA